MLQVLAIQIPCKLLLPASLMHKENLYDADKEHNIFKCLQSLASLTGHARQGNRLKLKLFGAAAVREGVEGKEGRGRLRLALHSSSCSK